MITMRGTSVTCKTRAAMAMARVLDEPNKGVKTRVGLKPAHSPCLLPLVSIACYVSILARIHFQQALPSLSLVAECKDFEGLRMNGITEFTRLSGTKPDVERDA